MPGGEGAAAGTLRRYGVSLCGHAGAGPQALRSAGGLAAEQKARVTYDNILRLSDDPDVNDVIKFLRAREIVHFQRFGEGLRLAKEKMDQKNLYFVNPSFDQ